MVSEKVPVVAVELGNCQAEKNASTLTQCAGKHEELDVLLKFLERENTSV